MEINYNNELYIVLYNYKIDNKDLYFIRNKKDITDMITVYKENNEYIRETDDKTISKMLDLIMGENNE